MSNRSYNFSRPKHPFDLKIMQENDYKNDCNGQKSKADIFETDQFLQLHVVFIYCFHVHLLRSYSLVN